MDDNNSVTHGLHWLTLSEAGWECAHPDCVWHIDMFHHSADAQDLFNLHHTKLSEAEASVPS